MPAPSYAQSAAAVPVTVDNFVRAESDTYVAALTKQGGGLGKLLHRREPASIDHQTVIWLNRDTDAGRIQEIVDRIKDVIKTGGEWVSSIEVEGLIAEVPGVQECAVIGVRDEKWGERPMAFVVRRPGMGLEPGAIRECLLGHVDSKRISKIAGPDADRLASVSEIPKTSVGKINKKVLRELSF